MKTKGTNEEKLTGKAFFRRTVALLAEGKLSTYAHNWKVDTNISILRPDLKWSAQLYGHYESLTRELRDKVLCAAFVAGCIVLGPIIHLFPETYRQAMMVPGLFTLAIASCAAAYIIHTPLTIFGNVILGFGELKRFAAALEKALIFLDMSLDEIDPDVNSFKKVRMLATDRLLAAAVYIRATENERRKAGQADAFDADLNELDVIARERRIQLRADHAELQKFELVNVSREEIYRRADAHIAGRSRESAEPPDPA